MKGTGGKGEAGLRGALGTLVVSFLITVVPGTGRLSAVLDRTTGFRAHLRGKAGGFEIRQNRCSDGEGLQPPQETK